MLKKIFSLSGFKISLLLTLFFMAVYTTHVSFFETIELKALDLKFKTRGPRTPGSEVAIVAVDEKSLDEFGRWPWPRAKIAELVNRLNEYGAKVVAFDVVFAETQENTELRVLERLKSEKQEKLRDLGLTDSEAPEEIRKELEILEREITRAKNWDDDSRLAKAIERFPGAILGYFFYLTPKEIADLDEELYLSGRQLISKSEVGAVRVKGKADPTQFLLKALGIQANIPIISQAGAASGFFNAIPDEDGTIRKGVMTLAFGDQIFPSLALNAVSSFFDEPILMEFSEYGLEGISIGEKRIPADDYGRMIVNYYGGPHTFPHFSASDVIQGELDPDLFRDRVILVGATAIGIYDIRSTPFSPVFPGVEVHANIISNIIHGDYLIRPWWMLIFDLGAIIAVGLILGLVLPHLRALYGLIPGVAVFVIYYLIDRYLFESRGVIVSTVYPMMEVFFIFLGITFFKYLTEEKKRKQYREAFSRYVSASVVNEILKQPDQLKLGGERKNLTVLFSDIRGFTSISESLDPETVVHILNEYLTPMTEVVFHHEGMLDKYIGDAIMAVFGAPLAQPDHAARACATALEMIRRLGELKKSWAERGLPSIDIGIGINTGPMSVGNMGSEMLFDYTVIGDSVNLASRLEGLNKEYKTRIIVSESTYGNTKELFVFRMLDRVVVKGKKEPVGIYELLGTRDELPRFADRVTAYERGFWAYQNQQWDEAVRQFQDLIAREDDPAARIMAERCQAYRESPPPPGWNGAYVLTKK